MADQPRDIFKPEFLEAYLLGRLTEEQVQTLDAHLRRDAATRRQFVRATEIMSMVRDEFQGRAEQGTVQSHEPLLADFDQLLADLSRMEAAASVIPAPACPADDAIEQEDANDAGSRSAHDLAAVGGYALRLALSSRPAKRIYAYAGVAAAVLLAFVLFNPFGGNEDATDAPFATDHPNDSIKPGPVGPALNSPVATLTATHNAEWAGGPASAGLGIGDELHPNQRLTLTAGFAEITTNDGAIAIIEAPATIEFTHNNNALRLHTGKLMGICETETSKGFLVRTTHMDVIDLGTRFGVQVDADTTGVHVFEGDVAVSPPDALDPQQGAQLGIGQSASARAGGPPIIAQADPDLMFVRDWTAVTSAPKVTGPIRYTASVPTALDFNQTEADDHILLIPEHNGLRLSKDIPVSKAELLDGHRFRADSKVPAGTVVDTYLLHGDIVGDDPDKGINFRGSIRFDRPILGVIANGIDLSRSHRALGLKGVTYPGMQVTSIVAENAGLEKSFEDKTVDAFVISEDRRTLSVAFDTGGSVDQLRVLVLADEEKPTN